MRPRMKLLLPGLAVLVLLAVPAVSAGAATAVPQISGAVSYVGVCANGGAGLCLQDNGEEDSLVANDNKVTTQPAATVKQGWDIIVVTQTNGKSVPFTDPTLDEAVKPGRNVVEFKAYPVGQGSDECAAAPDGVLAVSLQECGSYGTEWVETGSGRLANVAASDSNSTFVWLDSSGFSGAGVELDINSTHPCPAFCWSNVG